jgi:hypothetical protein
MAAPGVAILQRELRPPAARRRRESGLPMSAPRPTVPDGDPVPAVVDDRCGWRDGSVIAAAVIALAVGYAQFAPITVFGDLAERFGRGAAVAGVTAAGLGAGLGAIRLAGLASPAITTQADRWAAGACW